MNENDLIKQCQKGRKDAFEALIRLYYPYVSGFLLKICQDETLAEDLTQEAFLKMILNIEKYDRRGKASFGTWIITIAKNIYIDYLRKNHVLSSSEDLVIESEEDVYEKVQTKMQIEDLEQAIDELSNEQQLVIRLKYQQDLSLKEIAQKIKVPEKTVKSRIHEGTNKLRKRMRKEGGTHL